MASWRAASAGKAAVKMSTNLTGLDVCKNPHYILGVFYSKTLRVLAKMPSDYAYKKHTEQVTMPFSEKVTQCQDWGGGNSLGKVLGILNISFQILNDRTALLKSTQCPQELEKKIGGGQLEECIIQAKYELDTAKRILEERAWEPLISEPPKNQWKWPL